MDTLGELRSEVTFNIVENARRAKED